MATLIPIASACLCLSVKQSIRKSQFYNHGISYIVYRVLGSERTSRSRVASISRLLQIKGPFAKETNKRDDILQKRRINFRSLLIVATP